MSKERHLRNISWALIYWTTFFTHAKRINSWFYHLNNHRRARSDKRWKELTVILDNCAGLFRFDNSLSHKLFSKKDLVEMGVIFIAFCRKILEASRVQLASIVCTFASMDNISWSNVVQLASVPSTSFMKHPCGKSCSTSRLRARFLQV